MNLNLLAAAAEKTYEIAAPGGLWESIIGLFKGIGPWGWCIIVFTLVLALVMFPLDYYQRRLQATNAKKNEAMKPYLEKIQKQYANDRVALATKQRELNKKFKINMWGTCLPMILTLVIFFTMWNGFRALSDYEIYKQYEDTSAAYVAAYCGDEYGWADFDENGDRFISDEAKFELFYVKVSNYYETVKGGLELDVPINLGSFKDYWTKKTPKTKALAMSEIFDSELFYSIHDPDFKKKSINTTDNLLRKQGYIYNGVLKRLGQEAAEKSSRENRDGFLWIKNVWRPDVIWGPVNCDGGFQTVYPVVEDYKLYLNSLSNGAYNEKRDVFGGDSYKEYFISNRNTEYPIIMNLAISKAKEESDFNGLYFLVILAVGLSIISAKVTMKKQVGQMAAPAAPGAPNAAGMGKTMMYIMPIMMGFLALTYNAAFALYMVLRSATSLGSIYLSGFIIKQVDKKKEGNNIGYTPVKNKPAAKAPAEKEKAQPETDGVVSEENKAEDKAENKTEGKPENRTENKQERKPDKKPESRTENKNEKKPDNKNEKKPEFTPYQKYVKKDNNKKK